MTRFWLLALTLGGAALVLWIALLSRESVETVVTVAADSKTPTPTSHSVGQTVIHPPEKETGTAKPTIDLDAVVSRLDQPDPESAAALAQFYSDLPGLIANGTLDSASLVQLAGERYQPSSRADINFALQVAVATGDTGLINRLLADAENLDEQFRRNLEIELSRVPIKEDADVLPLLQFVEENPGNTLSKAVSHALVASGHPGVGDWLISRLQSDPGTKERRMLLNTIESVKASNKAVPQLIRLADSVHDDATQKSVIYGLGRLGGSASYEYLMQRVLADPSLRPLVVDSVSKSGSEQAWAQVQKEMLFSEDIVYRVIATESYLKGFASWDSEAVTNTANKILANRQDFPTEMVQLAELYLKKQQPDS
ncbi:MAG: HEAT repeat domain-containing protein [Pseudomonadota bacterium]